MSTFAVPVIRYGQLYQVEVPAETAQEAAANVAQANPAAAVAPPLAVSVVTPAKSHGHNWPH
jgi:hypothetical protein